jgi:hypothetical protein
MLIVYYYMFIELIMESRLMKNFNLRSSTLKNSGVFTNELTTLGNLVVNQVTLIGNTPESKHYDSFYAEHGADAVFFEVWKGNECKTFECGIKLKDWLSDNANYHNENPSKSIIL